MPGIVVALLVLAVGVAMVLVVYTAHTRTGLVSGPAGDRPAPIPPVPAAVTIAGTGAAIPLVKALGKRFEEQDGAPILVEPSIGSSGGVAALEDGRIDCAMVSRDLRPGEAQRYPVVSLALAPVVLATAGDVPPAQITGAQLADLYSGKKQLWADSKPVSVILRESGDSGTAVFAKRFPGFGPIHEESLRARRFRIALTDLEMERALLESPRVLGLFDYGTILLHGLELNVVPVDDLTPIGNLHDYPLTRPLLLVCRADPDANLVRFLTFVCSPTQRKFVAQHGYRPACNSREVAK